MRVSIAFVIVFRVSVDPWYIETVTIPLVSAHISLSGQQRVAKRLSSTRRRKKLKTAV